MFKGCKLCFFSPDAPMNMPHNLVALCTPMTIFQQEWQEGSIMTKTCGKTSMLDH